MIRLTLFACACISACLAPDTHFCGDVVCPSTRVCSPAGECVLPDQLTACSGKEDGKDCSFDGNDGICVKGACQPRHASPAPVPTLTFYALSGSSANDVLAVGSSGLAMHYDGAS